MSFRINTNIASLQSREYLRTTSEDQAKAIGRVTSGLRILSSGDDAAGLSIATASAATRRSCNKVSATPTTGSVPSKPSTAASTTSVSSSTVREPSLRNQRPEPLRAAAPYSIPNSPASSRKSIAKPNRSG